MTAQPLLSRLDRVKETGAGRWIACCPAHDDRTPSLAVRELDDGRILLHCFGGCDVQSVLRAVGLTFDDLYPERAIRRVHRERYPFSARDILNAVSFEAVVVSVAAADLGQGQALSEVDRERLIIAASRLQHAAEVANGE